MIRRYGIKFWSDISGIAKYLFRKRLFRHGLFWTGNLIFFVVIYFLTESGKGLFLYSVKIAFIFLLLAILFYIHQRTLVPRYYRKKRYWLYTGYLLSGILLFTVLKYIFKFYVFHEVADETFIAENLGSVFAATFYIVIGSIISGFLRYNREKIHYQEMAMKLKESEKQKLEAELVALKAQVNPHFMFNTLNNIYSLSLDKSEKAPAMILKLSDLMSYTLYDCKEEKVDISEEIRFVENYFELEKVRLDDNVKIDLEVSGNIPNIKIAPLLFIPFIENAFKHGINTEPRDPFIRVLFDFGKKDHFIFRIENRKIKGAENGNRNPEGIGITNSRKRLNLLYPGKHRLDITNNQDIFMVELEIELS
ncbi:MAG: histidine kinase [Bacteroidales bacterium]|nr:MAG: histidine kinase [Bacteroidales bacterium]